jgi:hypothetical protein
MARFNKVLKSLAHNAIGRQRISTNSAAASPLTTKGDLYTFSTSGTRLPVGTDGYALVADEDAATGLGWAAFAGANYYLTALTWGTDSKLTGTRQDTTAITGGVMTTFTPETTFTTGAVFGGNTTAAGYIQFIEDTTNGSNYTQIAGAATQAGNTTYTLPNAYPASSGYALVSTDAGVMSWAVNQDGNYYVTGGTYSAGEIAFSGTTSFPGFTVTSIPTGTTTATNTQTFTNKTWNGVAIGDTYISSATNWNDAYNNYVASAAYSAGTLTFTQRDGGTFTATGFSQATGTIGGSITDNQVAFGATAANSIEGSSNLTYSSSILTLQRENSDSSIYGPHIYIQRKRATGGDLNSGDVIGYLDFRPYKDDYDNIAASIYGGIEGTIGTDATPGKLMFGTAAAGANTVTERMRIDSAGNVGIGTNSPAKTLHVEGGVAVSGAEFSGDTGYGHSIYTYNQSGAQTLRIYSDSRGVSGGKRQYISASARLNIESTEHMGVGPTSSGEYLQLFSGPTASMYIDCGGDFQFRDKDDSSAVRMRLASADGALGVAGLITASGGVTMAASQDFTMGGQAVNDIAVAADTPAADDTHLVTAGYVNTVSGAIAGGAGTIGGTITAGHLTWGVGASTIGNFVDALTEDNSIYIGSDPSSTTDSAEYNTALGITALDATVRGDYNTAVGYGAAGAITDGTYNVAVGYQALLTDTGTGKNVAVGAQALKAVTNGTGNIGIGYRAAYNVTTTNNNIAIGNQAMEDATGAGSVISIGEYSGYNPTGANNIFMGYQAGYGNATDKDAASNVGIGKAALKAITDGVQNVVIGHQAGEALTTANNTTALGMGAANDITTGTDGVYIGKTAGQKLTTQNYNVVIGADAANAATGIDNSVVIGRQAMGAGAATGDGSVTIGYQANYSNISSEGSTVIIGYQAGYTNGDATTSLGGRDNVLIGYKSGYNISYSARNVAVGYNTLTNAGNNSEHNVAIGYTALGDDDATLEGDSNIAIGSAAMFRLSGASSENISIGGSFAKDSTGTVGEYNISIGSETLTAMAGASVSRGNIALGKQTLNALTTGNNNIAIGRYGLGSLNQATTNQTSNISIGYQAGRYLTTGSYNVYIGQAGPSSVTAESNKLYIANALGTPLIAGDFSTPDVTINGYFTVSGKNGDGTGDRIIRSDSSSLYIQSQDNLHLQAKDGIWLQPDDEGTAGKDVLIYDYRGGTNYAIFDGGTKRVGIGTSVPTAELDVRGSSSAGMAAFVSGTGNGTYPVMHVIDSVDTEVAWFEGNRAGDTGAYIGVRHWPASATEDARSGIKFQSKDDGGALTNYATLLMRVDDYTGGTEDGNLRVEVMKNGTSTEMAKFDTSGLTITGTLSATAKSFNIAHPLYKDKRLVHGSLEGPEHGIYIRGSIESKEYGCLIELPEYWEAMCEDYTVQLTPHGPYTVYIKEKHKDKVMIACTSKDYKFDYYVVGSRTDETLEVVQDG